MPTYFDFITPNKPVEDSRLPLLDLRRARPFPNSSRPVANSHTHLRVTKNTPILRKTNVTRSDFAREKMVLHESTLPEKAVHLSPTDNNQELNNKKPTAGRLASTLVFILVPFFLLIGGASILWPGISELIPGSSVSASVQSVDQQDVPEDLPVGSITPTRMLSWRLNIPAINLDTAIEEVGLTAGGNMAVPNNFVNVGWFKQGAVLGQPGTAVLAGHLNRGKNKPAVFWDLNKLKTGDYVYVTDGTKPKQRFRVTATQNYKVADAPLDKIFSSTEGTKLNLITCSGKWDKNQNDFTERLVVFTELAP